MGHRALADHPTCRQVSARFRDTFQSKIAIPAQSLSIIPTKGYTWYSRGMQASNQRIKTLLLGPLNEDFDAVLNVRYYGTMGH